MKIVGERESLQTKGKSSIMIFMDETSKWNNKKNLSVTKWNVTCTPSLARRTFLFSFIGFVG